MKKYLTYLLPCILGGVVIASFAMAQSSPNFWILSNKNLKPISSSWGLQVNSLGSAGSPCLIIGSTGIVSTSTCGGGGSVSTSSPITINNFPFWNSVSGALSGTSTLTIIGTTINSSGTITQNGTAVVLTTRNVNITSPLGGGGALSSDITLTCLTCQTVSSTLIAGGTATGPAITIATATASKSYNVACTNSTCTLTIPPSNDYLASSTTSSTLGVFTNTNQFVNGANFLANGSTTATPPITWSGSNVIAWSGPATSSMVQTVAANTIANNYTFWITSASTTLSVTSSLQATGGGANTSTATLFNLSVGTTTTSTAALYVNGNVAINTSTPNGFISIVNASNTPVFSVSTTTNSTSSAVTLNITGNASTSPTSSVNVLQIMGDGHINATGTKPTVSACGGGSPSVIGSDQAGIITTGTGAVSTCKLTFQVPYETSNVIPIVDDSSSTDAVEVTAVSSSSITMTFASALTGGTIYYYILESF